MFWTTLKKGRACDGKVPHDTFEEAEQSRIKMENGTGERLSSYMCGYCHKYHIGRDHRLIGDRGGYI